MRLRELQNCQWATPADLETFSQIGICLLFACKYLAIYCLHYVRTLIPENQNVMLQQNMILLQNNFPHRDRRSSCCDFEREEEVF